ncbi:unnamed protein product [Ceutorhynchus assimilis]|uniref:Uncharacterized protein n=1 Tax=Ceutorhynchus assimilis TaxID=467358 RepID=A0A9N9MCF0_9CUCU|nr:unnamed protein product [Ceutorhynchus assimilis]
MEIPKRRKKKINIVENFFDEGTPSGSEDELFNIATGNDLLNQILKICYKTADGCIGCHEIKYLIESSCSSPDSGFRTLSEEPQCKPSKKKNVNKFNSDKRKRSLGKLSQRKRTKVDLIANQKKNDKVFDELLEDYRGNSPIVSTKKINLEIIQKKNYLYLI